MRDMHSHAQRAGTGRKALSSGDKVLIGGGGRFGRFRQGVSAVSTSAFSFPLYAGRNAYHSLIEDWTHSQRATAMKLPKVMNSQPYPVILQFTYTLFNG